MAALPDDGEITFLDLYQNINSTAGTPGSSIDLKDLSESLADGSIVVPQTTAKRDAIRAEQYAIDEVYGANYPSSLITGITFTTDGGGGDTNTVDGEDLDVAFTTNGTAGDYTVRLLDSSNNTDESDTRSGQGTVTFLNLDLDAGTGYKAQVQYDQFNTLNDDTTFTHYDQIASGNAGLSYSSANVSTAGGLAPPVTVSPRVDTGVQEDSTLGSITSVISGDGPDMTGTYGSGESSNIAIIANTPGKIRFAVTHYGNPSNARNTTSSTTDLDITYTRAIDISSNSHTVNSGVAFTITAVSEGLTAAATMTVGYSTSNSGTGYTGTPSDKSIGAATTYVRNSQNQAFTVTLTSGTSLATYYGKAHYTSGAATTTATSAIYIAPAFTYEVPDNANSGVSMNVDTTRALDVSNVVGNGASVVITSSPDEGGGTNTATLDPGSNNRVYTISYDGAANYSQNGASYDKSRTVTVNPTVSLSLSDNQGGDNYPITDYHSDTITSATHGISPTLFTVVPTVVGDTVTYAWTTSGFTFTSGGGSTAGQVIFKKNSSGTATQTLTVSGNSTSANDGVSIVAISVVKAFTGGTKPATLREGTTFTVTSVAANYTQNVHLYRDGIVIGAAASIQSTMGFSIDSNNTYVGNHDGDATATYLRDSNNTDITRDLGTTILLPPLAVIDNFTATQNTYLKKIDLSWDTTNATDVTIDQGVGAQAIDDDITHSGLSNNTPYSYTLTAENAADEAVTAGAGPVTTINPAVTIISEGDTSFTYGDTDSYTVTFNKNFRDAVQVHVGHGLDATQTGGTEWHIRTSEGSGTSGNFDITFYPNYFGAAGLGSDFGTLNIVDYRVGSSDAGWFHFNQNRAFIDFTTTGVPTSLASGTITGEAIQMTWDYSAGAQTGVELQHCETSEGFGVSTSVLITNGATSVDVTDLDQGTQYSFRIRTYTTKTTTPLGSGESRTNYSSFSSTVNVSTIGWNEIVLEGVSGQMSAASGIGYDTPEAAHLSNDARVTKYYLDTTTLGTDTVSVMRAVDSAQAWDGNNKWYGVGNFGDRYAVAYVANNTGQISPANYILIAHTPPLDPTGIVLDTITNTSITIHWEDNSAIETGYKIYHRTGGAATKDNASLINTTSAGVESYNATSLASGTEHYFAVYAYRGDSFSGVLQGNEGTLVPDAITSVSASPTSWEYGTTGEVTISYTKNFTDTLTISMYEGYTTYQTKTNVGSGTGAKTQVFDKNWVTAVGASNWLDFKFSYYSSGTLISTTYNLAKAVEVTTPTPTPEVVASNGTSTSYCQVSWTTPDDTNDGYKVYRSNTYNGTYSLLSTDTASPYYDTTGTAGTTYYYKVESKRTMIAYTGGSSAVPRSVYSERSDYDAGWKATGGVCFAMDTKIMLSDGTEKEIQYLEMSDKLMGMKMSDMPTREKSADEEATYSSWTTDSIDSFETCEVSIESFEQGSYQHYWKITTEDIVLKATYEHPIFVLRDGIYQWSQMQHLLITDEIVNYEKETVSINSIEFIDESLDVVTIDVEIEDVYFAEGLLVHNDEEKG